MVDELKVKVIYKEHTAEFSGSPKDVYRAVLSYISNLIPTLSIAEKIAYSVDIQELVEKLSGVLAYSKDEGLFFLRPLSDMSDVEAISLYLIKRYVEHSLGFKDSPSVSMSEMTRELNKSEKTVSARLSEMVKKGFVRRLDRGDYTLTTLGIKELAERFVKAKTHRAEKPID